MRTLALGDPKASFYSSLRDVLPSFGDVLFRHERTFAHTGALLEFLRVRGIERVLMPNPYGNPRRLACYRALRGSSVQVIASDRGALPNSWFFDHGFNADSPSYAPEQWDHPLTMHELARVRGYIDSLRSSDTSLEQQGARRPVQEVRAALAHEKERLLFVPLQRPDDTVVRYFAGPVQRYEDFLTFVALLLSTLGDLSGAASVPWKVVLKKHPLETKRPALDDTGMEFAPDDMHVHDLLQAADAVLTLNSGVGLLALLFEKPTFVVGRAFYAGPGLARPISVSDGILQAARLIEDGTPPQKARVERFAHHLLSRVYSFGELRTTLVEQRGGSGLRSVTHHIEFERLRILGVSATVPRDRVLVVSPVVPFPITRGSEARIDSVLRTLLQLGKEVHLCVLSHAPSSHVPSIERVLRQRYPELGDVEVVSHPTAQLGSRSLASIALRAGGVMLGSRQRITSWTTAPPRLRRAVARMMRKLSPGVLWVNYAKLAPCIPRACSARTIVDTHDCQSDLLRADQTTNGLRRDVLLPLFQRSESKALRRFQTVVAISPVEQEALRFLHPQAEHVLLPAFIDPGMALPSSHSTDLLFVGSRSAFNVSGLSWFLREVWPRLRRERSNLSLTVAGSISETAAIRKLPDEGVRWLGRVENLSQLYADTQLVISPILDGAGMKIKLIEALAHRKAVVSTSHAIRGVELEPGRSVWVADTSEEFSRGVLTLLSNQPLREQMETAAAAVHAAHYSSEVAGRGLRAILEKAAPW